MRCKLRLFQKSLNAKHGMVQNSLAIQIAKWLTNFIFGLAFINKDTATRTIKYISSFNVFWLIYSRVAFLQSYDSNLFKI
jgi:hypothetical protein